MTPIRINCTFIRINAALADKFKTLQAVGCSGLAHCCHAFRVCLRPQIHLPEVDPAKWRINTSGCASQVGISDFFSANLTMTTKGWKEAHRIPRLFNYLGNPWLFFQSGFCHRAPREVTLSPTSMVSGLYCLPAYRSCRLAEMRLDTPLWGHRRSCMLGGSYWVLSCWQESQGGLRYL